MTVADPSTDTEATITSSAASPVGFATVSAVVCADADEAATNLMAMVALVWAGADCWASVPTAMTR